MATHLALWGDSTLQLKLGLVGVVAVLVVWHTRRPTMHTLEAAIFVGLARDRLAEASASRTDPVRARFGSPAPVSIPDVELGSSRRLFGHRPDTDREAGSADLPTDVAHRLDGSHPGDRRRSCAAAAARS